MEEKKWQEAEARRKDFNSVLIRQDKKFFTSEFFKVIQDAILIDPALQDNVLIPNDFFKYIYHMRCAINLHSIVNLSNRETVFFTSVDPMNNEYKDPDVINLDAPRLAWYKQKVWKKQQTLCNGLTSNLFKRKDLSSIKHDRTQSSFTTRSQLIVS